MAKEQNWRYHLFESTKTPITVCKFSKIFGGSKPPDPPRIIFVPQFASNLALPENIPLKKCQKLVLKSSEYTPLNGHIFKKGLFTPFSGSNIFVFS